jgi:hypothetical protein
MWSLDADYDGYSPDLMDAMYAATVNGAVAYSNLRGSGCAAIATAPFWRHCKELDSAVASILAKRLAWKARRAGYSGYFVQATVDARIPNHRLHVISRFCKGYRLHECGHVTVGEV